MDDIQQEILKLVQEANVDNPLQYVRDIVKVEACDKLKSMISHCKDCNIGRCGKSIPVGNPNASIMVIGGTCKQYTDEDTNVFGDEDAKRIIDIVFNDILNINTDEVFFINTVSCYPSCIIDDKVVPYGLATSTQFENCSLFVEHAIEIVQPLFIIIMGSVANNYFNKMHLNRTQSLKQSLGEMVLIKGIPAIITQDPYYFIEAKGKVDDELLEDEKQDFINHIHEAALYVENHYPNISIFKAIE